MLPLISCYTVIDTLYLVLMSTRSNNYSSQGDNLTPSQMRMARAALRIGLRDLAEMANVTTATLTRYENERGGMHAATRDRVKRTLESAGVEFIPENGGGAGVRLRKTSV